MTQLISMKPFFLQIKTGVHDLNTGYGSFCTYVTDLKTCLTPTEDKISITYEIMKDHLGLVQQFIDVCQLPGTCTIHLLAKYFDRSVRANGVEQDQKAPLIRLYSQFGGTICSGSLLFAILLVSLNLYNRFFQKIIRDYSNNVCMFEQGFKVFTVCIFRLHYVNSCMTYRSDKLL